MNLIFGMTTNDHRVQSFPFCPNADELQAFSLNSTAFWGGLASAPNNASLGVYGMGGLPAEQMPTPDMDSSVLALTRHPSCSNGNGTDLFAVATFLVLNITMTKGSYYYTPAESVQPIQSGFVPTCSGGVCQFDADAMCIGVGGMQNCAKCVKTDSDMAQWKLNIWTSYYGTDVNGKRFLSGSSNPLNFRQYATDALWGDLRNDISNL
eukprot:GDKJ01001507.1.p1 GENE.GDKJ01001507.1~~GDKJ01001507.1.p1  ORF type:complete len:223 (-),score=10.41 GDKJ01001507.1:48-671(-)